MSDTKMLQMVLNGQSKINERLDKIDKKIDDGFAGVNERIDKLGLELAELQDDAPTLEEFDALERRVSKIEKQIAS